MKHVIIGNGAAGITAAEKIRELGKEDSITIISSEDCPVYSKCMLPDYIGDKLPREKLFIRDMKSYEKNRIEILFNESIKQLDISNSKVWLDSGRALDYDKLLLAAGGSPFIPYMEGLDKVRFFTLNSVKDADHIRENVVRDGTALIVGGGLTGIELGFALKNLGMKPLVIDRSDKILPKQLDSESMKVLLGEIIEHGIEFSLSTIIEKIESSYANARANGGRAVLSNGREFDFDLIILTIGSKPNVDMARETGIKMERGILVNDFMETSVKNIFAAGDIAESINKLSDEYVSSYVWPNAMAQGRCAAFNMAGVQQEFSRTQSMLNSVQLRDIPFMSMGVVNPAGNDYEILTNYNKDLKIYKRVILKDNIVKGLIFYGDMKNANMVAGLARKGVDVKDMKKEFTAI